MTLRILLIFVLIIYSWSSAFVYAQDLTSVEPIQIHSQEFVRKIELKHHNNEQQPIDYDELDHVLKSLEHTNDQLSIHIISSADTVGKRHFNERLSEQRAKTVGDYITNNYQELPIQIETKSALGEINTKEIQNARNTSVSIYKRKKYEYNVGDTLNFIKIFFEGYGTRIIPASKSHLINLLQIMDANPNLEIKVYGHVCCINGDGDGEDLKTGEMNFSWSRAGMIKAYLIFEGIASSRIEIEGLGHKFPIYDESDLQTAKLNARADIVIIDY